MAPYSVLEAVIARRLGHHTGNYSLAWGEKIMPNACSEKGILARLEIVIYFACTDYPVLCNSVDVGHFVG